VGAVSWADPGDGEPEREILERSPGWGPRALAWVERRLGLDRLAQQQRSGWARWLPRLRRSPRWTTAAGLLGLLVLAGATVGVVVTQSQHAPAAGPPASSAPGTGTAGLGLPGNQASLQPGYHSSLQIRMSGGTSISIAQGSTRVVFVQLGTGATTVPEGCAQLVRESATGYRTVLGDVLVPSAQLNMLPNGDGVWRYWQGATFLVIGGSPPVTMSVPRAYQARAALDLEVGGIGSTFHVHACPNRREWTVATGGFYLKAPAACVPLDVQVGTKSAIVWFALGERCPSGQT
jgi:hypothetical protein